jgi:hypothetical protein
MNEQETREIINGLGGFAQVGRMLGLKTPSVHGWLKTGIPEGRLIELAARIEVNTNGAFSRQSQWPTKYQLIWPELANTQQPDTHGVDLQPQQQGG